MVLCGLSYDIRLPDHHAAVPRVQRCKTVMHGSTLPGAAFASQATKRFHSSGELLEWGVFGAVTSRVEPVVTGSRMHLS